MSHSRRRFLRTSLALGGAGLGVGAVGTTAYFATHQPKKRWLPLPADNDSRPVNATVRKRVVVVGGGLAGLVASMELSARKLDVTLVERAGHLGGKLGGWTIDVNGESFPGEHGFHGFFGQYYNLYEELEAAGALDNLTPPPDYPILFSDGTEDVYAQMTRTFPLNLLNVVHQSKHMKLADFVTDGPGTLELMRFSNERTYSRYDDTDFWSFTKDNGINRGLRESVIYPFAKTTLNAPENLSAAEGIRFFHFFFIGNPEGLWYRYSKRDCMSSVIEPFDRRLRSLGAKVQLGQGVRRFRHENGRVTGVELEGATNEMGTVRVSAASIATEGYTPINGPDGSAVYVGRRAGGFVAFDARCTHMGCPVRPSIEGGGFECPCHGGRYDSSGNVTHGPPERPLRKLPVVASNDELVIGESTVQPSGTVLPCDYAISACEVRGTRELFRKSELLAPELTRKVLALGEADPYLVYRIWLDKPVNKERTAFYTCSGYGLVDSLAVYTMLQEPYISWGKRTGHSVIELHSYAVTRDRLRSSDQMAAQMIDEMRRILPELASAKVLHGEYAQQNNFSGFAPGSHRDRPSTETEIPNLFLAGDHVRMEAAVALMEAATMSGRLAANAILRQEGLREIPIPCVPAHGPMG